MLMFLFIMLLFAVALAAPGLLIYQLNKKMYSDIAHFQEQLRKEKK